MEQNYKQRVIEFFNGRTAYDDEGDSHPNEAKRLLDYVPLSSGQSVLDIATGTGLLAIPAVKAISAIEVDEPKALGLCSQLLNLRMPSLDEFIDLVL